MAMDDAHSLRASIRGEEPTVNETFWYELLGPFADTDAPGADQLALHSVRHRAIVHMQPAAAFDYRHPDLRATLLPYRETEEGTLVGPRFEVELPADWMVLAGTRRLDPLDLAVAGFELIDPPLDRGSAGPPTDGGRVVRIRREDAN